MEVLAPTRLPVCCAVGEPGSYWYPFPIMKTEGGQEAIARTDPESPAEIKSEGPGAIKEQIQAALDEIVLSSLKPLSMGLAILYVLLAVAHKWTLEPSASQVMTPVALITAIVFVFIFNLLSKNRVSAPSSHALAGVIGIVVGVNGLMQLVLTLREGQTTNLMVLILGMGILFLDYRWFGIVAALTFAGWFGILQLVPFPGSWLPFGIGMVAVTVLSTIVLTFRLRTFRRIEELHQQDQVRQDHLERALSRTETARQGESEARTALEGAVQELQDSEERFRRLADATFEGILIHRNGFIRDCNQRAAEMFGIPIEKLTGRRLQDFIEADAEGHDPVHLEDPTARQVEAQARRDDGVAFPVEIARTAATVSGERVTVSVVRDVTRQHEAERLLRAAAEAAEESNRAKSTFLANMSHELRTPLNAVIGFSNILKKNREGSFAERDLEYLDRIVSNGKHLLALINDVLDLSKIEAGRMDVVLEKIDLDALVQDLNRSFELQASRKGVSLVLDVPERMDAIRGDGHRLKQILFNLVGNAMKFTDEGAVTIRVVQVDGKPVRLEVQDSGIGIPDHRINEIFSPFQQVDASTSRKYGGTGLGLAISRSLCEMMGFELGASSVEGQGSTFSIDLAPAVPVKARFQPGSVTVTEDAPKA